MTARLRDQLLDAPAAIRRSMLVDFILSRLKEALDIGEHERICARVRFEELGVDSKRALEFKEFLEQEFGCALRTTLLFDYPTPEALAGHMVKDILHAGAGMGDVEEQMRRKLEKYRP
jgi:acyl carrier protein